MISPCAPLLARSCLTLFAAAASLVPAYAQDVGAGGKLILTNGISTVEGASGGGLTPWATIAGNDTADGIGAQASATHVELADYDFRSFSAAVGVLDRVELSYDRQVFDTNKIGGALGLGNDYKLEQNVFGAKVRVAGDVVYGPEWMPGIAVGAQYKKSLDGMDGALVKALGAKHDHGVDYYVSFTKLFLRHSVLANVTVRATKANQLGLLGFGSAASDKHSIQFEGSLAYQLSRKLVIGGEYRTKPDRLAVAIENDWFDGFVAYAIDRHLTATVAYTDLGSIATVKGQRGVLFQLQAGF
jgi:hypothetical protein